MDTLRELTAGELRATLARRRISAAELARRLGWSQAYMARRVDGRLPLDMDDLDAITKELGISLTTLIPREAVRPNDSSGTQDTAPRPRRHRPVRTLTRSATATRPVPAVPLTSRRPKLLRPRTTHRLAR